MAPATSARRLSALRQFFRFLQSEGGRQDDPTATIDSPRRRRSLPKYLSEDDVDKLLSAAHGRAGGGGRQDIRLVALLEVLYATGLRVSELVGLRNSALSRDRRLLTLAGKGGRERMVPLTGPATKALAAYEAVRETFLPKGGRKRALSWLFPSRSRAGHLTRARFAQLLKEVAADAGIDPGPGVPPCAAPFLCQPPARPRRRSEVPATDAWDTPTSPPPRSTHTCWRKRLKALVEDAHPLAARRKDRGA